MDNLYLLSIIKFNDYRLDKFIDYLKINIIYITNKMINSKI